MSRGLIKPIFGTQLDRSHPLAQGLVASYLFNEGCGDLVHDSAGMNDGKMTNMAPMSSTSGWNGQGLAFDGTDDYVVENRIGAINVGVNYSLFALIKSTDSTGEKLIVTNGVTAGRNIISLNANTVCAGYYDGVVHKISGELIPNTRTSILYTKSGSTINLYINGVSQSGTVQGRFDSGSGFRIGAANQTGYYFIGDVYVVGLYSTALSINDAIRLYADPYCMYPDQTMPAWMIDAAATGNRRRRQLIAGVYR